MRNALAVLAAASLAACQPAAKPADQAKGPTREELGQDDPTIPFKPAPVGPPRTYEATSRTAMAFTPGKLTLTETPQKSENLPSGATFAFGNGYTLETTLEPGAATQGGDDNHVKWADIFPDPSGAMIDPEKIVMYSVDIETIPPKSPNGGFCAKTSFIATYTLKSPGAEDLQLAAFQGDRWPPKDDTALCGTFMYSNVR
ncbi:MAG TPA: hypothetical protein VG942_03330 [Hyphomonadaceae bacterium]|nr:hypothetical protein [Hyphomonadaceae bacterium]